MFQFCDGSVLQQENALGFYFVISKKIEIAVVNLMEHGNMFLSHLSAKFDGCSWMSFSIFILNGG